MVPSHNQCGCMFARLFVVMMMAIALLRTVIKSILSTLTDWLSIMKRMQ